MVQGGASGHAPLLSLPQKQCRFGGAFGSAFSHEPAEPVFSLDDIRPDKYNDFRLLQTFPMTLEEFSQKRDVS